MYCTIVMQEVMKSSGTVALVLLAGVPVIISTIYELYGIILNTGNSALLSQEDSSIICCH